MKFPVSSPAPWATAALIESVTDSPICTSFTAIAVSKIANGTFKSTERTSIDALCR